MPLTTDFIRGDGRVFPSWPGEGFARDKRGGTQTRLTHFPDSLLIGFVGVELHAGVSGRLQCLHCFSRAFFGLFFGARTELGDQPAFALRQLRKILHLAHLLFLDVVDQPFIEAFQGNGTELQNFRDVIA